MNKLASADSKLPELMDRYAREDIQFTGSTTTKTLTHVVTSMQLSMHMDWGGIGQLHSYGGMLPLIWCLTVTLHIVWGWWAVLGALVNSLLNQ